MLLIATVIFVVMISISMSACGKAEDPNSPQVTYEEIDDMSGAPKGAPL